MTREKKHGMFPYGSVGPSPAEHLERHAYPQFILFGDSITQGAENTCAAALRDKYIRRVDIVNRGFSGYTSPLAQDLLPQFYPTPTQAHVRLLIVFFGANDACLPGSSQYVPLEKYVECLKDILLHDVVRAHGTKLVLIVPAPVDEWQLVNGQRTAANTKRYADACRAVGTELGVPTLDLWSAFMNAAGWRDGEPLVGSKEAQKSEVLARFLSDGLHFTAEAYRVLFERLMAVIYNELPDEAPESLAYVFPEWSAVLGK